MYHHLDKPLQAQSGTTNKRTRAYLNKKRALKKTNLRRKKRSNNNNNNKNKNKLMADNTTNVNNNENDLPLIDSSVLALSLPSTTIESQLDIANGSTNTLQTSNLNATQLIEQQQQELVVASNASEFNSNEHSITNCFNNNNCNSTTCRYNQLSRILHSFFNDNNPQGLSKLDLFKTKPSEFKPNKLYIKLTQEETTLISNNLNANLYEFNKNNSFKKLLKLFDTSECYYACLIFNKYNNLFNDESTSSTNIKYNQKEFLKLLKQYDSLTAAAAAHDSNNNNNNSNTDTIKIIIGYLLKNKETTSVDTEEERNNDNGDEIDDLYYQCKLCLHYIQNPITLVCGCTYCKTCLIEYNDCQLYLTRRHDTSSNQEQSDAFTSQSLFEYILARVNAIASGMNRSSVSSSSSSQQQSSSLLANQFHVSFKCKQCNFKHDQNSTKYLDSNVIIKKIQEQVFTNELEVRSLRNDIRKACVECKIDYLKAVNLFEKAFNLDATNHLLLADLFLLNYYLNSPNSYDTCMNIVSKVCDLIPNWTFAHFMQYLTYTLSNNKRKQIDSLLKCLSIDFNLDYVKNKLFNLLKIYMSDHESMQHTSNEDVSKLTAQCSSSTLPLKRSLSQNPLESDLKRFHETKSSSSSSSSSSAADDSDTSSKMSIKLMQQQYDDDREDEEEEEDEDDDDDDVDDDSVTSKNCNEDDDDYSLFKSSNITTSCVHTNHLSLFNTQNQIDLIKLNDLECSLCYRLLYEPVTTPCGHLFCCSCLDRVLDYNDKCPLCTKTLVDYLAERRQFKTKYINSLIKSKFLHEFIDRKKGHEDELNELILNETEIPIFVCVLALPSITCPLHIYEPKYRLMLRRCLSTTKRFGMCTYVESNEPHRYANYGCALEIRDADFNRDGRSFVDTIGTKRFRVLSRSLKDGYNMAKVEWIVDQEFYYQQETERQEVNKLNKEVFYLAKKWYDLLPRQKKTIILNEYGQHKLIDSSIDDISYSENGPNWHWFLLSIMPLEERMKLWFLYTSNVKARLGKLKVILALLLYSNQQQQQQQHYHNQQQQQISQNDSDEGSNNGDEDVRVESNEIGDTLNNDRNNMTSNDQQINDNNNNHNL